MWRLYAVFLIGYAAFKYFAVPEAAWSFEPGYIQSSAIVIALTGVAPFFIAWMLTRPLAGASFGFSAVVGLILCTALCIGGYSFLWNFFIPPDPAFRPPLWDVAIRGYLPGVAMGCILAFGLWRSQSERD